MDQFSVIMSQFPKMMISSLPPMHLLPILSNCEIVLLLFFPVKSFHIGLVGSILDGNLNELEVFRDFDPSLKNDGPINATHACYVFFCNFSKSFSISSYLSIESVLFVHCFGSSTFRSFVLCPGIDCLKRCCECI